MISKQDSDARPIMWIGMSSDRFTPLEMTDLAEKQIKNRLQTVEGVSSISLEANNALPFACGWTRKKWLPIRSPSWTCNGHSPSRMWSSPVVGWKTGTVR